MKVAAPKAKALQHLSKMNDRPTPETDALIAADQHHLEDDNFFPASVYWRMCDHARRLERERDEARERADRMFAVHAEITEEVMRERDEAREQLAKERAAAEKLAETVGSHEFATESDFSVVGIAFAEWKKARHE